MTSKDDKRLSEDEMDELVDRVVERLGAHDDQEADADERVRQAHEEAEAAREEAHEAATEARERARERARRAKERAREGADRRRERADEATGLAGLDDLGERIERSVEASLEAVAEDLERSLTPGRREPRERRRDSGVTMGPDDTGRKAVYKTQLQKGGRVAVPDAEIEALDLDPGDTLQVVLYPVD